MTFWGLPHRKHLENDCGREAVWKEIRVVRSGESRWCREAEAVRLWMVGEGRTIS